MRDIGWLRRNRARARLGRVRGRRPCVRWSCGRPDTIPFYLVWISLAVVYGFRPWVRRHTVLVAAGTAAAVIAVVILDGFHGDELSGKLLAVPLLALMFVGRWSGMRGAARSTLERGPGRRRDAGLAARAPGAASSHDASHELRTPVTIARGHLELLRREQPDAPELDVALDELGRMERIVERLLLLATSEQPGSSASRRSTSRRSSSDVFIRWSEVAPRAWRLDVDLAGRLLVDPERCGTRSTRCSRTR